MPNYFYRIFALILIPIAASYTRAEIETCSGCKLNRLADVKKFVMNESLGALSFLRVTRKFISGHNPDIVLYIGNEAKQRIDMTPFTFDQLVQVMKDHGFSRPGKIEL